MNNEQLIKLIRFIAKYYNPLASEKYGWSFYMDSDRRDTINLDFLIDVYPLRGSHHND